MLRKLRVSVGLVTCIAVLAPATASAASTEVVSVSSGGALGNNGSQDPAISADGRYVAFTSAPANLVAGDTNGKLDVFVHDRQTGLTERVSVSQSGNQLNGISDSPAIS